MTQFKTESTYMRAKDALAKLFALVVDSSDDLAGCLDELQRMSAADVMAELKSWRDDSRLMPEWRRVLSQHGFY